MIIYEINIKIDYKIYNDYIIWLNNHIKKMLSFDGFIKSNKYIDLESNKEQIKVIIHYYIKSQKYFKSYIDNNSKNMRKDGMNKFQNNIVIKRRVLKPHGK